MFPGYFLRRGPVLTENRLCPSPPSSSNSMFGKSKLGGLFGNAPAGDSSDSDEDGNDALKYHRRKQPSQDLSAQNTAKMASMLQQSDPQQPASANPAPATATATAAPSSAVCWHCSLNVFKFNTTANQYEAVGNGVCGLAILGSVTTFNIVIYNKEKTTLVMTPLTADFEFTLQAGGYISFYDNMSVGWSLKFINPQDMHGFAKNVALTKYHCAIFAGSASTLGAPRSPNSMELMTDDAELGEETTGMLASRDLVKVTIKVWSMSPNANDKPHLIPKNVPAVDTGNETRTVVLGGKDGQQMPLGGLDRGLVGMCKKGTRFMLISPSMGGMGSMRVPEGRWLFCEVHVHKMKKGRWCVCGVWRWSWRCTD